MTFLNLFFHYLVEHPISLFFASLVLLLACSYGGKFLFKKRKGNEEIADNGLSIIIGAILSFLALLTGFVLSTAITGYNARSETEQKEAVAIGLSINYLPLLSDTTQIQLRPLLESYLNDRINFFNPEVVDEPLSYREKSFIMQLSIWNKIIQEQKNIDSRDHHKLMDVYSHLYETLLQTEASWENQIPIAAWVLLFICAIVACVLIGYDLRGVKGKNGLPIFVPLLISLSFFIIAEIDTPATGFIEVTPDNLVSLQEHYFLLLESE